MTKLCPEDYTTSVWSGGKTTQLVIEPPGVSYAERTFLWRISSATVETKESDFTPLRGEMRLRHNDRGEICLRPYDVHRFSGADRTHSFGCCTDFNLMLRRDRTGGDMEAIRLHKESRELHPDPRAEKLLLYCAEGECLLRAGAEQLQLRPGESGLVTDAAVLPLSVEGEAAILLLCQMWRV